MKDSKSVLSLSVLSINETNDNPETIKLSTRIKKESEEFPVQKEQLLPHVDTLSALNLILFCRLIDGTINFQSEL